MSRWEVNRGVGRPLEFKGLKAQYLYILGGLLVGGMLLTVVLYMSGVGQVESLLVGVVLCSASVWYCYHLNHVYGEHGLMKRRARARLPRRIAHYCAVRYMVRTANVKSKSSQS